jgi:hypothetical protein
MTHYDRDPYAWAKAQADAHGLADEMDDLINTRENEIESRLENLLLYLLKWRYQPMLRCGSWRSAIIEARFRICRLIKRNPSLSSYPSECLTDIYPTAKVRAIAETGRDDFPEACPWTITEILSPDFLPPA